MPVQHVEVDFVVTLECADSHLDPVAEDASESVTGDVSGDGKVTYDLGEIIVEVVD
jgi:hypothetical protein